jgi:aminoglycoside phosphotransferase (APT) family kinase protein
VGELDENDAAIASGLAEWFRARRRRDDVSLGEFDRPSGGYSSETVFFDCTWVADGAPRREPLVLRTAPPGPGTFGRYDLAAQFEAQGAARSRGVPVAEPILEPDPRWIGTPFIVMPRIEGHVVDGITHGDRWLRQQTDGARHELYQNLLDAVTRIHRSDTDTCPSVPRRDNAAELDFWEDYLQWSSDGRPVGILVEALGWCRRHRPVTDPEPVLLWGDVRFENVVFGDDLGLRAVLDWDMCSIGAAEHDLAWLTSLDSTMERLFGSRVPGFPGREETIGLFEGLAGRPVRDFGWYETLAMVKSTAIMTRIGYLRRDAGEPPMLPIDDNPVLDLVRERLGPP